MLTLFIAATTTAVLALAQGPSDADIQAAMERGKTTSAKKLWDEIKKTQQYRINRAGFSDPIEKKVLILFDRDPNCFGGRRGQAPTSGDFLG
jgi:hypothetical protein